MCALQSIRRLCRSAVEAHEAGNGANADFLLHQACVLAEGLHSPVLEAKVLNTRGVIAMANRRRKAAVIFLAQAQAKVDARIGRSNKLYAVISNNLRRAEMSGGDTGSCARQDRPAGARAEAPAPDAGRRCRPRPSTILP
jgi:hypothetical protein